MNRELALFAELWPHINKKSPAGTEDSVSLSEPILTQIEGALIDERITTATRQLETIEI